MGVSSRLEVTVAFQNLLDNLGFPSSFGLERGAFLGQGSAYASEAFGLGLRLGMSLSAGRPAVVVVSLVTDQQVAATGHLSPNKAWAGRAVCNPGIVALAARYLELVSSPADALSPFRVL